MADVVRAIEKQVNAISEGSAVAVYNANTVAPSGSAVTYGVGDVIKNSNATVLGTAGSQYVITQFICVAAGSPGTWVECRTLTGT